MLSDEEKKAIKDCDSIFICLDDAMSEDSANDYRKSYKILKNLIEKQSKEIEELKDEYNTKLLSNAGIYQLGFKDGKDSVKNKIKAKIEEVEQWELYNMKIPKLSTLDERLGAKIGIKYVLQSLL